MLPDPSLDRVRCLCADMDCLCAVFAPDSMPRVEQMIAKRECRIRVVLSDIRYDLSKIVYGRLCDFDSEIHFGMSARTSSIDLLSSG